MKKIIFNDDLYQYMQDNDDAIIDFLNNNDIDPLPNEKEDAAYMLLNDDLDIIKDDIKNFDLKNNYKIYVAASLGLWYGRKQVFKIFGSLNEAIFGLFQDYNCLYFDKVNTTLKLDACHHDGCNVFKFYKIVNGRKKAITYNDLFNNF